MSQQLSPDEAAALLSQVESARATMRHVIREHRGHYHLWIWGAAWMVMPLLAYFGGDQNARYFPLVCIVAGALSFLAGFSQTKQIRRPANLRFGAVLLTVWSFAALFPFVLRIELEVRSLYANCCLVAMQSYVVAGLWTDSYLLWLGVAVAALILGGFFFFPALFWIWMAVFGGGTLIVTGFYVRHFWR